MSISRRSFLKGSALLSVMPMSLTLSGCTFKSNPFSHGVASGDPLHDAVIIWTRVTIPEEITQVVDINSLVLSVRWQVSTSSSFATIETEGKVETSICLLYTSPSPRDS